MREGKGIAKIYKITVGEEKNGANIYYVKSPNVKGKNITLERIITM